MTIELLLQAAFGVGFLQQLYSLNGKLAALTATMESAHQEQEKIRTRVHDLANRMQAYENRVSRLELFTPEPKGLRLSH